MLKERKNQVALAVGVGALTLLLGATVSALTSGGAGGNFRWFWEPSAKKGAETGSPNVLSLALLPAEQRTGQLEALAQDAKSPDRNRARYLLAADLIQQQQGHQALKWLSGLESDYQVLAPYIALKRAQACEVSDDKSKAVSAWQELLKTYPQHPVAAEAMLALSRSKPEYVEQVIAQFPSHPRTLELIRQQLQKNSNQLPSLLHLLKHSPDRTESLTVSEELTNKYAAQLKPEDWEAIASSYWENFKYTKAAEAYSKAPRTSLTAYRIGRGFFLGGKKSRI